MVNRDLRLKASMWRDASNYWPMPSICIGRETTHFS